MMKKYDPVLLAQYASDNNLLEKDGWKSLRCFSKNKKKLACMVRQARLASKRNGFDTNLVCKCRSTMLRLSVLMKQTAIQSGRKLAEYETFIDKHVGALMASGWRKINVHLVFDV